MTNGIDRCRYCGDDIPHGEGVGKLTLYDDDPIEHHYCCIECLFDYYKDEFNETDIDKIMKSTRFLH